MRNGITLAGVAMLALSGAAIAQTEPAMNPAQQTPPAAETPAMPDAPQGTTAAPEATMPADAGTAAPTTATQGAASGSTAADATASAGATGASAAVQADWAKYDKENAGYLTPLQFGNWVLASRGQDMTAQVEKSRQSKAADLPAVKVLNATGSEFVKADTDHDKRVTPAELTTYLGA